MISHLKNVWGTCFLFQLFTLKKAQKKVKTHAAPSQSAMLHGGYGSMPQGGYGPIVLCIGVSWWLMVTVERERGQKTDFHNEN